MGVELKSMKCPACGARLRVDPHSKFAECPACETQVNIYDELEAAERIKAGKASGAQRDTMIFPFSVSMEQHRLAFIDWLSDDYFPLDIYEMVEVSSSAGYQIPFYVYRDDREMLIVPASDQYEDAFTQAQKDMIEMMLRQRLELGGYKSFEGVKDRSARWFDFDYDADSCFSEKGLRVIAQSAGGSSATKVTGLSSATWEAKTSSPFFFSVWVTKFCFKSQSSSKRSTEITYITDGSDVDCSICEVEPKHFADVIWDGRPMMSVSSMRASLNEDVSAMKASMDKRVSSMQFHLGDGVSAEGTAGKGCLMFIFLPIIIGLISVPFLGGAPLGGDKINIVVLITLVCIGYYFYRRMKLKESLVSKGNNDIEEFKKASLSIIEIFKKESQKKIEEFKNEKQRRKQTLIDRMDAFFAGESH